MPTFGTVIREARLARGLSMGQLASSVGRTAAAVRLWERDEAVPGRDVLEKLAGALDVDAVELTELAEAQAARRPEPAPDADPFAGMSGGQTGMLPVSASAETALTTAVEADGQGGRRWDELWSDIRDPDGPYLGYVRATLAVVIGIVMLWILVWALGELFDALGQVWDSLDTDEEIVDALGAFFTR